MDWKSLGIVTTLCPFMIKSWIKIIDSINKKKHRKEHMSCKPQSNQALTMSHPWLFYTTCTTEIESNSQQSKLVISIWHMDSCLVRMTQDSSLADSDYINIMYDTVLYYNTWYYNYILLHISYILFHKISYLICLQMILYLALFHFVNVYIYLVHMTQASSLALM